MVLVPKAVNTDFEDFLQASTETSVFISQKL